MKYLIRNEHWEINKEYNLSKLLYLLVDRFDNIENSVFYVWSLNEDDHREYDLPSLIHVPTGDIHWNMNNIPCRGNNVYPCSIWGNGVKEWYNNGEQIKIHFPDE